MEVATKDTPIHPVVGAADKQQQSSPKQQQSRKSKSQVKFIRPAQMSLFAGISCFPPLGQVTHVRRIQKALSSEADDTVSEVFFFSCSAVRLLGPIYYSNCVLHDAGCEPSPLCNQ